MPQIGMHMGLRYDIIGEYASILFAILLLVFISLTKPKKSQAFKFLVLGTIVSIFATAIQIVIVEIASNVEKYYERSSFTALLVIFLVLYLLILILIYFRHLLSPLIICYCNAVYPGCNNIFCRGDFPGCDEKSVFCKDRWHRYKQIYKILLYSRYCLCCNLYVGMFP